MRFFDSFGNRNVVNGFIFLLFFSLSCSEYNPSTIRVATAANAQFVIKAIADEFARESEIRVELIVGSSGKLTAQILQGAPFDLFISADTMYPNEIYQNGISGKPITYALGTLVLWSMSDVISLELLQDPKSKIAIPNPELAPYGRAGHEVLEKLSIPLNERFVQGESVSQTNHFIQSEAVSAGFTSRSTLFSPNLVKAGTWMELSDSLYAPIIQDLVIIQKRPNRDQAERFVDFILSDQGKSILKEYGYTFPQ